VRLLLRLGLGFCCCRDEILGEARMTTWKASHHLHYLQLMYTDWLLIKCEFGADTDSNPRRLLLNKSLRGDIGTAVLKDLQVRKNDLGAAARLLA
jgi:hypothetical protein